jgi:3-dehydroquinate synthase
MTDPKRVHVDLGSRAYDILIGRGLLTEAGHLLLAMMPRRKTMIVTDENVARHHLATLEAALAAAGIDSSSVVLPAGETTKSFSSLETLCDSLLAAELERKDAVIALGGGVIGDLTGFASSIIRRGIGFVQIPTTLLAQVDSSVGGKTGINTRHGKNLIGSFYQPSLVLADLELLHTLPLRERAAGYAEVAKYGLLGDSEFFSWLETHGEAVIAGDHHAVLQAVETSCRAKAAIVVEDETETGRRALLNLGHTFAHALEAATGYSQLLLHGEAVAIGMVQAFRFSEKLGHCATGTANRVAAHLKHVGLPVDTKAIAKHLPPPARMAAIMRQDKKASGGRLTFILVHAIGAAFVAKNVDEDAVIEFLTQDLERQ